MIIIIIIMIMIIIMIIITTTTTTQNTSMIVLLWWLCIFSLLLSHVHKPKCTDVVHRRNAGEQQLIHSMGKTVRTDLGDITAMKSMNTKPGYVMSNKTAPVEESAISS